MRMIRDGDEEEKAFKYTKEKKEDEEKKNGRRRRNQFRGFRKGVGRN